MLTPQPGSRKVPLAVSLAGRPWEPRTVQTAAVGEGTADLDANLRLTGATENMQRTPGGVHGTVFNRGRTTITQLRAQTQEGQAQLIDRLAPGETKTVDAPTVPFKSVPADEHAMLQPADDVVTYAAAGRALSKPDQVAVVGLTERPAERSTRHIGVVVITVPIQEADTMVAGSGGARPISASSSLFGTRSVSLADLRATPGAGPL